MLANLGAQVGEETLIVDLLLGFLGGLLVPACNAICFLVQNPGTVSAVGMGRGARGAVGCRP